MKNNLMVIVIALIIMLVIGSNYAGAVPKTPDKKSKTFFNMNDVEKIDYLNKKIADAQREIDFEYKFAMANKIPDGPLKEQFREAEEAWEAYSNTEVSYAIAANNFPGSYSEIKILRLKLFLLEKRIMTIKYQTVSMEDTAVELK